MSSSQMDYYEILEVSRTASDVEIKKSFRRLAMKFHPDRCPDDPEAEIRFKEINAAYDVLKDPQKRAAYDHYGAEGVENGGGFGGFSGGFGASDLGDIFEQMFGGGGTSSRSTSRRQLDIRAQVEITLAEAYTGVTKEITIETRKKCTGCLGSGSKDPSGGKEVCPVCHGAGKVRAQQGLFLGERPCTQCQGIGQIISNPCDICHGDGTEPTFENVSINIPAGIEDGTRLRLQGRGEPASDGGRSGDLYILVSVEENDLFQREGTTLFCNIPLRMTQAALGCEIEIPIIDGTRTKLKIPAGTQTGQTFRLKGKGFKVVQARSYGDMYVQVIVEVPTQLTEKQKELLEEFDKEDGNAEQSSPQHSDFWEKVKDFFKGDK